VGCPPKPAMLGAAGPAWESCAGSLPQGSCIVARAGDSASESLLAPAGNPPGICPSGRTNSHGRDHKQPGTLVERVAALDIGNASLTACVRVPDEDKPGVRRQEVRTYATTTPALLELRDWMARQGVTLGVMEPPRRTGSRRPTCPRTTSPARWSTPATSRASPAGLKRTSTRSGCASSPSGACSGPRSSRPAAPAARPDPLPAHLDPGTDPGKAARRETARRCPDRAVGGDQRHLRRLRPGHARRPGGRRSARRSAPCAATGRAEPHVGIPPGVRRTDPPRPPCQRGDRPADPPCPAVSARTAWISPGAPSFFRRQSRS